LTLKWPEFPAAFGRPAASAAAGADSANAKPVSATAMNLLRLIASPLGRTAVRCLVRAPFSRRSESGCPSSTLSPLLLCVYGLLPLHGDARVAVASVGRPERVSPGGGTLAESHEPTFAALKHRTDRHRERARLFQRNCNQAIDDMLYEQGFDLKLWARTPRSTDALWLRVPWTELSPSCVTERATTKGCPKGCPRSGFRQLAPVPTTRKPRRSGASLMGRGGFEPPPNGL
jgi:hypothetical protein